MQLIGLGCPNASFRVYLAAPPAMAAYQQLTGMAPMQPGDIEQIYRHCGNGWRKVFNVYAKLLSALPTPAFSLASGAGSWQQFRDQQLLQANSDTALCFCMPTPAATGIQLIAGRTLARQWLAQGMAAELQWLTAEFAVDPQRRLLVTPFFDYRQLNNAKISCTAQLLLLLQQGVTAIACYQAVLAQTVPEQWR